MGVSAGARRGPSRAGGADDNSLEDRSEVGATEAEIFPAKEDCMFTGAVWSVESGGYAFQQPSGYLRQSHDGAEG